MKRVILLVTFLIGTSIIAQENVKFKKVTNKGKFFIYWGWNFSSYLDSDIHFRGNGYDFTLRDVKATDRPTEFSFYDYFIESTLPQTNFRIGYFFKENYTISFGVDHMKYVTVGNQMVEVDGYIKNGNHYDGVYNSKIIQMKPDFLKFEHSDGLNYLNTQLYRFDDISHWFGLHSEKFQVNLTEGLGIGVLLPRTNATFLGKKRHDKFHLAGYGSSIGAGLNLTFFKHFFIQTDAKVGYIYMPDIRTTYDPSDRASQSIVFFQYNFLIGGRFRL